MTAIQVNMQKAREEERANKARELETQRHNQTMESIQSWIDQENAKIQHRKNTLTEAGLDLQRDTSVLDSWTKLFSSLSNPLSTLLRAASGN